MRQTYWQTEQERLRNLAEEYRASGYEVFLQPTGERLPDFLSGLQPDLIVSKGDEHIVVEVTARATLKGKDLGAFVGAVEGRPGWHFDLVIVDPPNAEMFGDVYETLDARRLGAMIDQAEAVRATDARYAALLVWVAVEGALVEQLSEVEGAIPNRGPKRLVKEAISLGLVEPEDRSPLERLAEFRNRFVHAMVADIPPESDLNVAIRVARSLLSAPMAS